MAWLVGLLIAGCAGEADHPERKGKRIFTVYAAASLTDALREIGGTFEREHDAELVFNFTGSGALARQLLAAPQADLFLSANERWMDEVEAAGRLRAESRRVLLSNRLVVVAHPSTSWELEKPRDLAGAPVRLLALGDPDSVPAGAYAREWLRSVELPDGKTLWERFADRVSPAPDVRAALLQVAANADLAGIVYRTDVAARPGKVRAVWEVSAEAGPTIDYPAAVLRDAAAPGAASAFLDFLSGPEAATLFGRHGFVAKGRTP